MNLESRSFASAVLCLGLAVALGTSSVSASSAPEVAQAKKCKKGFVKKNGRCVKKPSCRIRMEAKGRKLNSGALYIGPLRTGGETGGEAKGEVRKRSCTSDPKISTAAIAAPAVSTN